MRRFLLFTILLSSILPVLLASGCTPSEPAEVVEQTSTMRAFSIAYGQFTGQNRGRPPQNEQQLRSFIEKMGPAWMESHGIASIDDLFVSPRDGQPYVVLYGNNRSKIIAYEAEGKDGKRFVADNLGSVEEADEARFKELVPDAK